MTKSRGSGAVSLRTVVVVSAAIDLPQSACILVYGVTGSGKSTLAARLSSATGIPWYSVDDLTWEPGWTAVPVEEQRRRIEAICQHEEWILDSAYSAWLDVPWASVELIIGLDYPRWQSFGRLCRRTLIRMVDRTTVCNGNRESLRNTLSKDSILAWHFRSFASKRQRIRAWEADPVAPPVRRIRSSRDLRRLLPDATSDPRSTADATRRRRRSFPTAMWRPRPAVPDQSARATNAAE